MESAFSMHDSIVVCVMYSSVFYGKMNEQKFDEINDKRMKIHEFFMIKIRVCILSFDASRLYKYFENFIENSRLN